MPLPNQLEAEDATIAGRGRDAAGKKVDPASFAKIMLARCALQNSAPPSCPMSLITEACYVCTR